VEPRKVLEPPRRASRRASRNSSRRRIRKSASSGPRRDELRWAGALLLSAVSSSFPVAISARATYEAMSWQQEADMTRLLFHRTRGVPVNLTLRLGRSTWQLLVYKTTWRWWAPLEVRIFRG